MNRRAVAVTVVACVALVAIMAYGSVRHSKKLAQEASTFDARAAADTMLQAFSDDDYATFSAGFTETLAAEMNQAAFEEWRTPLVASLGSYLEIVDEKNPKVTSNEATRYVFHAAFEGDESVQFAIVVRPASENISRVELKPDK